MEFINNPWVSTILGGIISTLIVSLITYPILSKKQKREYIQKIKTANTELLYIMRPLVVKKQIPTGDITDSIIEATAEKHEVSKGELFNITSLANELIREVMENAFLESEQKIELSNKICELKHNLNKTKDLVKVRRKVDYSSLKLLITISVITVFWMITIFGFNGVPYSFSNSFSVLNFVIVICMSILSILTLVTIYPSKNQASEKNDGKDNT